MRRLRRWWRSKKVGSKDEDNGQKDGPKDEDNGQNPALITPQSDEVGPSSHGHDDREELRRLHYTSNQQQRHFRIQRTPPVTQQPGEVGPINHSHDDRGQEDNGQDFVWNSNLKIEWTEQEEERLRADILKEKIDQNGEKIKMTLLVFGQTGHGKSTLCNGFRSALKEESRVCHYHQVGRTNDGMSFTIGIQISKYRGNLRIMDMSGLFESVRFTESNITNLLCGNVDFDEELDEHLAVCNRDAREPAAGTNNISCLVLVVRPDKEFGERVKTFMDGAEKLVKKGVLCRHAVIPFMDKIDPIFEEPKNLPQFLKSSKVKKAVKDVSQMTGVPLSAISVVSNYWNQSRTDLNTNILLLHALDDILYDAKEHHERRIVNRPKQQQTGTNA